MRSMCSYKRDCNWGLGLVSTHTCMHAPAVQKHKPAGSLPDRVILCFLAVHPDSMQT
jgi:hypothetical protein